MNPTSEPPTVKINIRVTPEAFRQMELPEDRDWELHEGEIIDDKFPSLADRALQFDIAKLLKQALPNDGFFVLFEMPFETGPNVRSADVGVIAQPRYSVASGAGILTGAPELVVEVRSKSNTKKDLAAYKKLCFDHGTLAFWLVIPEDRTVTVSRQDEAATSITFEPNDVIPLAPLGDAAIPVNAIFEGIV